MILLTIKMLKSASKSLKAGPQRDLNVLGEQVQSLGRFPLRISRALPFSYLN